MVAARLAAAGALLADRTRAGILCALMDGRAHTGGELARHLSVGASTVSEHLGRLRDAGWVAVEAQGRHRYYRLSGPDIAALLESIGAEPTTISARGHGTARSLVFARTCYDHLAGQLAVDIYDTLRDRGVFEVRHDGHHTLTGSGRTFLAGLGVDVPGAAGSARPLLRPCLDWTERRHHLAGRVGAALLTAMFEQRWIRTGRQPRSIRLTPAGRRQVPSALGLDLPG